MGLRWVFTEFLCYRVFFSIAIEQLFAFDEAEERSETTRLFFLFSKNEDSFFFFQNRFWCSRLKS